MESSFSLFGPIDAFVGPHIEYVLLALVLANIASRAIAHSSHVRQADDGGAEAITRHPALVGTNVLLVLATFYYTTLHSHGGAVLSVLVLGMFVADLFEFEARKVEARQEIPIERPNGAIVASMLVLAYTAYQSVFFIIEPIWSSIV